MAMYSNAKLVDAVESIDFIVTKQHLRDGLPRSSDACAGVLGALAAGNYMARVYRKTFHVQRVCGGPVERFVANDALKAVELMNDLKAIPELGANQWKIHLEPPPKGMRLSQQRKWERKRRAKGTRNAAAEKARNARNARTGKGQVRIGVSPKDALGIRPHAPRHSRWA